MKTCRHALCGDYRPGPDSGEGHCGAKAFSREAPGGGNGRWRSFRERFRWSRYVLRAADPDRPSW